jgi:hypothetical protein
MAKGYFMMSYTHKMRVYLEIGSKRTFAGALDWSGLSRNGRDETAALAALLVYAKRYAAVVMQTHLGFWLPKAISDFDIIERFTGSSSTDFGTLGVAPSEDARSIEDLEVKRLLLLLDAGWEAFDRAVADAQGIELRKGPRGGGRDLNKIQRHVIDAERAYLSMLGWSEIPEGMVGFATESAAVRQTIREALSATAPITHPGSGPRGGAHWMPRYFARKVAWHVLDHAWEIEDRSE